MADGGGRGPAAPSSSSSSSSSSPLDGAFLLQLLRNPPQSQQQPKQQNHQQKPIAFFPHETLNPHRDPAVASAGPTTSYLFASEHHPSFFLPSQDIQFSPPLPTSIPPSFSSRVPPGFAGSPPVYRGDFLVGNSSTNHQRRDRGGGGNLDSLKDRGCGNANGNYADSGYWHKANSMQTHQSHAVSNQRRDLNQNVHCNRREGKAQPLFHLQQREFVGTHGGGGQQQLKNNQFDQYGGGCGRKNGLVEEFDGWRSLEDPDDDFGGRKGGFCDDLDDLHEQLEESLMVAEDDSESNVAKNYNHSRSKDARLDLFRGHNVSSQRARIRKRELKCRYDIDNLTPLFLAIYRSLIPADEERGKQKQLLLSLGKLVNKEWPNARFHLYGSCANSFGVSNSDIDLCLDIDPANMSKSEILLKLADILQSGNLQNVQALTHARVPIVKMRDPVTGISCDICINNLLGVTNTKLLRDYARIDGRLRQLAFIVKHWAKSRGVNEAYRGTLSSYAYVLMCIHFLQRRKPAILPCLQEMEPTYVVEVDGVQCAYFDQVDILHNFGSQNNESVARLLWGFFHYWAYYHDYTNDVISVRTGLTISKRAKGWTRRIGNDRHLICIEDPFETSHDLGRVVDKFSIKILREEFERAADIMQDDANPCVALFEPYVPRSLPD